MWRGEQSRERASEYCTLHQYTTRIDVLRIVLLNCELCQVLNCPGGALRHLASHPVDRTTGHLRDNRRQLCDIHETPRRSRSLSASATSNSASSAARPPARSSAIAQTLHPQTLLASPPKSTRVVLASAPPKVSRSSRPSLDNSQGTPEGLSPASTYSQALGDRVKYLAPLLCVWES
jgi:hypothetical protein